MIDRADDAVERAERARQWVASPAGQVAITDALEAASRLAEPMRRARCSANDLWWWHVDGDIGV